MADSTYTFSWYQPLGYFHYVDLATQTMLIAEPGKAYAMKAVEEGLAVPPPDGRWEQAAAPAAVPARKALVSAAVTGTEGGE